MAKVLLGTASNVQELLSILEPLPADAKVRVPTDEITYTPDVYIDDQGEAGCYVLLEP